MFAMNVLHIPKRQPRRRASRQSSEPARLELTLEAPREQPRVTPDESGADEPQRGIAEVDFYI